MSDEQVDNASVEMGDIVHKDENREGRGVRVG